ncbi:MAG: (d)CMP kinase [candidate division WOR-3 bacterium]|nr:MAG: (d)CMP kinase [candidate division WOR-3 bacterium]
MTTFVVAIDGGAGSGKSTTAKGVAQRLHFFYLDTGAMYRAFTLKYLQYRDSEHISATIDIETVNILLTKTAIDLRQENFENHVYLNGNDVTVDIRTSRVSSFVSQVSAIPEVRRWMVQQQREIAVGKNVVCEGRDIGTIVFPDAQVKIFMTADLRVRAQRRQKELAEQHGESRFEDVLKNLQFRDNYDSTRTHSPLKKARDAIVLDTTHLTIEEEIAAVENIVRERLHHQ